MPLFGMDLAEGGSMALTFTTEQVDPVTVLAVTGEVDLDTADALRDQVAEVLRDRPSELVLDLSGVGFLDSSGLGALLEVQRRLTDEGGYLRLVIASRHVRRVIDVTGMEHVLDIYDTRAAALTAQREPTA
jgi:anti-sigma B factor antagonist